MKESPFDRDIEIFATLQKSAVDEKTGRIQVRGVASDNSVDFTNEIVTISEISTKMSVLNSGWGKLNYDHHAEVVGEITAIGFITPEQAREKYGIECVGTVLEIEGWVYPITDKTPPNSDVREVHKLIDAGARLGFSVQGGVGKRVPVRSKDGRMVNVAVPSFINQVAITGQPVNMNTVCVPFAKSLAAFLLEGTQSPADWEALNPGQPLPPLLYMGDMQAADELIKSVVASGAAGELGGGLGSSGTQALANTDGTASTGGDATRTGASDSKTNALAPTVFCSACSGESAASAKHCANCGHKLARPSAKSADSALSKSLLSSAFTLLASFDAVLDAA